MFRFLFSALLWLSFSLPAAAFCNGTDLRPTLEASERTTLDAQIADMPYSEGNHWRARRGDQVIHLVGTVHLNDPRLDPHIATLTPLIETADAVLLEMTETEQDQLLAEMASNPDLLILKDTTLPDLMTEADWAKLSDAMSTRGMPPFMVAKMQPWYVSVLLATPPCIKLDDPEGVAGLDAAIDDIAIAAGVPSMALEPFDTAFRLFQSVPRDVQIDMIRSALVPNDLADDLVATLLASYFEERHAESWVASQHIAGQLSPLSKAENDKIFDVMEDALLEQRNRAWIPVILDAVDGTQSHIFVAFGAAHLAGETGVLKLLERESFTLERMPF